MQCYWHRQRMDGLFLLNAFPCSQSSSPTTTQMSRILAGRNADGYYRSGLIWALERGCSLCMSLLIMIRLLVAETLQRCWPHPLPWADVLASGSCELFSKLISLFHLFLIILTSSPLHLDFFFPVLPYFTFIRPCFIAHCESDKFGRFCVSGHYIFTVSGLVLLNR